MYATNVFPTLQQFTEFRYGFSQKSLGDMNINVHKSLSITKKFADNFDITVDSIVAMNQVHSTNVQWVTAKHKGTIISELDGLLTKEKQVFLLGTFADCIPLVFYEKKASIVGIAHAGWKGTLYGIAEKMVTEIIGNGGKKEHIFVGIGPSIRVCCYDVTDERITLFHKTYPNFESFDKHSNGKRYLQLEAFIKKQLLDCGISEAHIEDIGICTKESDYFFSYRRDKKDGQPIALNAFVAGMV